MNGIVRATAFRVHENGCILFGALKFPDSTHQQKLFNQEAPRRNAAGRYLRPHSVRSGSYDEGTSRGRFRISFVDSVYKNNPSQPRFQESRMQRVILKGYPPKFSLLTSAPSPAERSLTRFTPFTCRESRPTSKRQTPSLQGVPSFLLVR